MNPNNEASTPRLIDTHCHLDMEPYARDLDAVLGRAGAAGVANVITIGISVATSRKAVRLAHEYSQVYATVGIHPHDAAGVSDQDLHHLARLADDECVVGFGEIGLDYAKQYAPVKEQKRVFDMQLALARQLNLPVIIHDREAHDECLDLLRSHAPFPAAGVMHCFSGDWNLARKVMDLGFYISIPGIVTFKNAAALQDVARRVPADRILLETDGPFLAPVPFRGRRNEPAYLIHTAQKVAELRQCSLEELASQTTSNCRQLFNSILNP